MSLYRCYFFDKYSLSRAEDLEAATDTLAIQATESLIARTEGRRDFFEVWNRSRLVHKRGGRSPAVTRPAKSARGEK